MNYFSLCIANLGVVPLTLLRFFLFLPAFLFLRFLLVFVICVLDAIITSFNILYSFINNLQLRFISSLKLIVKRLTIICFAASLLFSLDAFTKDILISKGEQFELSVGKDIKYSIGNKSVVSHKFLKRKGALLIKGKMIGFTDLVIWIKEEKFLYRIFVTSKRQQLKSMEVADSYKRLGLNISSHGKLIVVEGEIKDLKSYQIIKELSKKKNKELLYRIEVSKDLQKKLIEAVLLKTQSHDESVRELYCYFIGLNFVCKGKNIKRSKALYTNLEKKYYISFQNNDLLDNEKNYHVSFKIVQIDNTDLKYRKIGLNKIDLQIKSFLENNFFDLYTQETVRLEDTNVKLKVLAQPSVNVIPNEKSKVQLGTEIPILNQNAEAISTEWKFYGLEIDVKLNNSGVKSIIEYKTNLTTPNKDNSLSGTNGSSKVYLSIDKYQKLFEINYNASNKQVDSLPIINKIPFLRTLFSSDVKGEISKKIICYVKVRADE